MTRIGEVITAADAVVFLNNAAGYFEGRPTQGEDRAHWANVYNAENCRKSAALIERQDSELRLLIWNEAKRQGLRDEDAYKRIAQAIEARRAATTKIGAVEDESAVAKPCARKDPA